MELSWHIKPFASLTVEELYAILRLRSRVFVVEQKCVYLDLDGKDQQSLCLFGIWNNQIVAHARLFNAGICFENASIGRVVVDPDYRNRQWGQALLKQAITSIETHFGKTKITIGAQLYLQKFYENHQFEVASPVYIEDGIPHIEMIRTGSKFVADNTN